MDQAKATLSASRSVCLFLSLLSIYKAPQSSPPHHTTRSYSLLPDLISGELELHCNQGSAMSMVTSCTLLRNVTAVRPAVSSGKQLQSGRPAAVASLSSQWRSRPLSVCCAINPKGEHNPKTDLHPFNIPAFGKLAADVNFSRSCEYTYIAF